MVWNVITGVFWLVFIAAAVQLWRDHRFAVRNRAAWAKKTRPLSCASTPRTLQQDIKALARPTLLLSPADYPVFSKFGGAPDLGDDAAWPTSTVIHRFPKREVTTSMGFVAQLDLAEVRAAGGPDWLPDYGRLYSFC